MSRIDFDDMWEHHFGRTTSVQCPCCNNWTIHKKPQGKSRDWIRGHIIHHKNGGPDIYENVRPICRACNINDKGHESSYHYMALGLDPPRMTVAEADAAVAAIWDMFDRQRKNLGMVRCLGEVESTGHLCEKKRKPHSYFCKVHGRKAKEQLIKYQLRFLRVEMDRLWQRYYDSAFIQDELLIDSIADGIDELQDSIENLAKR